MRKEFAVVALATLITIMAWLMFDITHKRAAVQLPANIQEVIKPINPNFDLQGIDLK